MARARTKGTNLIDMVKTLRTHREKSRELLPERLHHYLDEHLNVAAWYPEEDMIELVRVLAQLIPGSREEALVLIGRLNARMHLQGTYAHLLVDAQPDTLPIRAVALWQTMHDTGKFRLTIEKGRAEARLSGYGHPTPEMCTMLGAYLLELFEIAGLKDPTVDELWCCRLGARDCCWRIEWTPEHEDPAHT